MHITSRCRLPLFDPRLINFRLKDISICSGGLPACYELQLSTSEKLLPFIQQLMRDNLVPEPLVTKHSS